MKTENPFIDNILETQTAAVSNWMDTTKKFQSAITTGQIQTEGQSIYNDWMEKQINIFGGMQAQYSRTEPNAAFAKPEEFFKNWYTQQAAQVKQLTDFNQNVYANLSSFGKTASPFTNNFTGMNSTWTNIYNTWMAALNTSFESIKKATPTNVSSEAIKKMFETNNVYNQLKDLYSPAFNSFKTQDFSFETFKKMFDQEAYKKITEGLFSQFFNNTSTDEVFSIALKNIQDFFVNQNGFVKEYAASFENIQKEFPNFVSGDFAKLSELYKNVNGIFEKSFGPVLNLVSAGKDKENIKATIILLDRLSEYSVKQAEFQHHFYQIGQKTVEATAKVAFDKLQKGFTSETESQSFDTFYNDWVKSNEEAYIALYSSEEFSKLKSELMSINSDVKQSFEKQFESTFNVYPIVFRSEVEELHKTIYDLKKTVKALQDKYASNDEVVEKVEKNAKKSK